MTQFDLTPEKRAARDAARTLAFHMLDKRTSFHSVRVAKLVKAYGGHYDTETAAYLHDVLEDTRLNVHGLSVSGIPANIAEIVVEVTNVHTRGTGGRAYRKMREAERLSQCSRPARLLKACDRLDNLTSMKGRGDFTESFLRLYAHESLYLISHIAHDLPDKLVAAVKDAAYGFLP
jgi:(p)ppGpp synthase/HD superfamily hydrolase